jgi:hypothetical protein
MGGTDAVLTEWELLYSSFTDLTTYLGHLTFISLNL